MTGARLIPGALGILLAFHSSAATPAEPVVISNGLVKVVVERRDGALRETYFCKKGGEWRILLESGSSKRTEPELKCDGRVISGGFESAARLSPMSCRLSMDAGSIVVQKTITLLPGDADPLAAVTCRVSGTTRLNHLFSTYSFAPGGEEYERYAPLDFIFTPQLRPEPEHVIADHVFRSPALMMQEGSDFVALVPDVRSIDGRQRVMRSAADLQVAAARKPFMSFGLVNWLPEPYRARNTHVYYVAPDSLAGELRDTTVAFAYRLFLDPSAAPREGFRSVVRYHWKRTGHRYFLRARGPQAEPFRAYVRKAWYEFLPAVALDTVYQGTPVTLLRQARLAWSNNLHKAADNDAWFNVWFNSLRTAYGMELYGKEADDAALRERAERVLNLALLAPQKEGIAPTIFYMDSAGGHWVADHAWGGIGHGENYAMFHNAWTCTWLLRWGDLLPARREEILRFTRGFGEFLLKHQQTDGVIPSWYDPITLEPAAPLRDDNAETAGAALFLTELFERTDDRRYLEGAERAMKYIFTHVVPGRTWYDFETFFSCSRKPLGFFDSYTGQPPQNTLSMHQAAEACLALHRVTHDAEYRRQGEAILDYLCLYQQVWSPRWLSRELFGGFGVQNTDAEWSDARQGYFAVTLMDYYDLTGREEYFERGVAALRSMFSLFESPESPRTAENYAHSGMDAPAGVTGLHWGTGSSMTAIHMLRQRYGDAHVNLAAHWGAGIDGCTVTNVAVRGSQVDITLSDNVSAQRPVRLTFAGLSRPRYTVRVNGRKAGDYDASALEPGITIGQGQDSPAAQPKQLYAVVFLYRGSVVGNNAGAGGFYVRTGDTTWAKLTRSNVYSFGLGHYGRGSTQRHYLAAGNGVHRSTDGGKSWRILTSWRTEEILGVVPDPLDSAVIYAATPLGVFKTVDDGATWNKKMHGFKKWFIQRIIMDRDDRKVLYAASEDDLYRTTDAGEHWTPLGVGAPEILSVLQHPARPKVMLVGLEDRAIRFSTDRGETWKPARVPSKTSIYCLGASADGSDLYAGGWQSGLWRSEDHGATWSLVWKAEGIEALYWIFVHPDDASHLLVATAGSGIWESRDRGLTWRHAGLNGAQVKQIELYP